jgi:hypothetical protein
MVKKKGASLMVYNIICQKYDDPNTKRPLYYLLADQKAWQKNRAYMIKHYPHTKPLGTFYFTEVDEFTYAQVLHAKTTQNGGLEGVYLAAPSPIQQFTFIQ